MSDLDLLRGLGDQIVPPPFDSLRETARRRTRRTTTATVVSAAAAVALVAGFTALNVTDDDKTEGPSGPPTVDTTRPFTYAEGSTLHYGDQTVTAPAEVAELDVTDDGVVVRTADGGIWFTDGGEFSQIGTLGDPEEAFETVDFPYATTWGYVVSNNVGSRVAWLEFPQPRDPELVVHDTRSGEQTHRVELDLWQLPYALLASVTEEFAFFFDSPETGETDGPPLPQIRIHLATGSRSRVNLEEYVREISPVGTPRTMMVSHAEGDETPLYRVHDGIGWQFSIGSGGRVVPQGGQPLDARDGATRKRFAFDAPAGYPNTLIVWLTHWIDDDTVVMVAEREGGDDDLLECRISTGSCVLTGQLSDDAVVSEIWRP